MEEKIKNEAAMDMIHEVPAVRSPDGGWIYVAHHSHIMAIFNEPLLNFSANADVNKEF